MSKGSTHYYCQIPELEQLSFGKKHDWFRKFTAIELRREQRVRCPRFCPFPDGFTGTVTTNPYYFKYLGKPLHNSQPCIRPMRYGILHILFLQGNRREAFALESLNRKAEACRAFSRPLRLYSILRRSFLQKCLPLLQIKNVVADIAAPLSTSSSASLRMGQTVTGKRSTNSWLSNENFLALKRSGNTARVR